MNNKTKLNKKAVIAINLSDRGSSGTIMDAALSGATTIKDTDIYKIVPQGKASSNTYCFANKESKLSFLLKNVYYKIKTYKPVDGTYFNFYSKKVIRIIKKIARVHETTVIHIHNIHHSQLNVFKLLAFIAKQQYNVVITVHDAWLYTGGCYCYDHVGCTGWQHSCENCQYGHKQATKYLYKKINLLNKIDNLHLVAVSNWVKRELGFSKIKNKPVEVIYGCTDIELKGKNEKYDFGIDSINKKILLSVSDYWNDWKGIKYLQELSSKMPDNYLLVLVGGNVDLSNFKNSIHINQTNNRTELARIYSSADVYISTSQTETLGLSCCEAQICGCPVVTFGNGGSKETIENGVSGYIAKNKDVNDMLLLIKHILDLNSLKKENILSNGNKFNKQNCSQKYAVLYKKIFESQTPNK